MNHFIEYNASSLSSTLLSIDIILETYNVWVGKGKNFNLFWHKTLYLYKHKSYTNTYLHFTGKYLTPMYIFAPFPQIRMGVFDEPKTKGDWAKLRRRIYDWAN